MAGVLGSLGGRCRAATERILLAAGVVLCCSLLLGLLSGQAAAGDTDSCKARFSFKRRMTLCHNASRASHLPVEVCQDAMGFVLTPLVLAPLAFYADCDKIFHVDHLYKAQCLGNLTHREDDYDRIVYDILDKVSGQNQISLATTVVDRFPLSVVKDGGDVENLSAFVIFKKLCKSADPEQSRSDMINLCSNQTVNGTFIYFTLRGMVHLPDTPSMCRCVLRPAGNLKLLALDVRLQNASTRRCGKAALKIEANGTTKDIPCHKMSALYGNREMYVNDSPEEVTLTLTYISKEEMPRAVWIDARDAHRSEKMSVSCGGFMPLPTKVPNEDGGVDGDGDDDDDDGGTDDGGDDDGDGGGDKQPRNSNAGANFIIIPACVVGAIIIVVLLTIFFIKRRRSGSYSGIMPLCQQPPCCQRDDDDLIFYKAVNQQEPVYAEPGKPRPSTTTPPYTFPVDAKLPNSRAVYSEPDPNGTLNLPRSATPPPIPELPPPGSPPMFPPGTPPPKPERTLLRKRVESTRSSPSEEEDYDHIVSGGKTPLKAPRERDRQNNIIGDGEADGERAETNLYDCLQHGDNYSQLGEQPRQQVKDNVYDTTA